jgi:hypothetical protein
MSFRKEIIGACERELLVAAKEAAVIIAEMAKATNVSPRGPGFDRLVAAIKAFEVKHGKT